MIRVTLDLCCTICGHTRFLLPIKQQDGPNVSCANCSAYRCKAMNLEQAIRADKRLPG